MGDRPEKIEKTLKGGFGPFQEFLFPEGPHNNQTENDDFIASGAKYRLLDRLGKGGMGDVWKAERISAAGHRKLVALKFVGDLSEPSLEQALRRETQLISELRHDNIASYIDSGFTKDGRMFCALEYIDGHDVRKLMDMHGLTPWKIANGHAPRRIPDKITAFIMLMAARALKCAHEQSFLDGSEGLVNRDVSPDNFVIDKANGFIKQIDFGTAITRDDILKAEERRRDMGEGKHIGDTLELVGKLRYMAPEAVLGRTLDHRSDICSLGYMAYEMSSGIPPNENFGQENNLLAEIYHRVSTADQPIRPLFQLVPEIDRELSEIISKATDVDPDRRYTQTGLLMKDLYTYLYKDMGIGVTVDTLKYYIRTMLEPEAQLESNELECFRCIGRDARGRQLVDRKLEYAPEVLDKIKKGRNPART